MRRVLRDRLHRRVVVSMTDGSSFEGVLVGLDREAMVLQDVVVHSVEKPVGFDGEFVARWDKVAFLQFA